MTSPLPSLRTFLALAFTTVCPMETWPSPPTATSPPLRTVRIVVPCQEGGSLFCIIVPFRKMMYVLGQWDAIPSRANQWQRQAKRVRGNGHAAQLEGNYRRFF